MNEITHFIFSIYHYSLMLRDTLEYMMSDRKEFKIAVYNQRKAVLTGMLDNPSPLRHFLDQNKETGEKIAAQLHEFLDEVYGEDSTIVKVHGEQIEVDAAQHLTVYNYVIGLHETVSDIVRGYLNYAKGQNALEEDFEDMVEDDERLYRVIVYLTIFDDIVKTFAEFNQAMRETNGQPSPQSNFIVNDLRRYIGFIKFSAQHNKIKDPELLKLIDDVEKVFSYMEGKEKLPEGKDFGKVFDETKIYIKSLLAAYETKWRNSFTKVFQDVIEFEKARAPKA